MPENHLRAFVSRKFPMGNDPAVLRLAKTEAATKNTTLKPNNADQLVENYLGRFRSIAERPDPAERERGITAIKRAILRQVVTKYQDIPSSYWRSYEQTMRSRGLSEGWESLPEDKREEIRKTDTIPLLEDQYASLNEWLDYFFSDDSKDIPDELKYWVIRSLTQLQAFEKTENTPHIEFTRRSKGSLKKFPDLNPEALRYVVDAIEKKINGGQIEFEHDIDTEDQERFKTYLQNEKFGDLYAWALELMNPIPEHLLPEIRGEWRTYQEDSDSGILASTLRGKNTGWCIAGKSAAMEYINTGDVYVYFSYNEQGQPVLPRAVIHVTDGRVVEVGGIAYKQNLDPFITPVVRAKLDEFPNGKMFEQKTADIQRVTIIEQKTKAGQALDKTELAFLYEVDKKIQGFRDEPDLRISELRKNRDVEADMLVIFDCTPDQIAHTAAEVALSDDIKAYVGPLYPNIFNDLIHLEHIYTKFPEKKIRRTTIEIGGKDKNQLKAELKSKGIKLPESVENIMSKREFTTSPEVHSINLIRLTVADLGFTSPCEMVQVFSRAKELGLERCPPETGLQYRLQYMDQPDKERVTIGMDPIMDSYRTSFLLQVSCSDDLPEIKAINGDLDFIWPLDTNIVFRLRETPSAP